MDEKINLSGMSFNDLLKIFRLEIECNSDFYDMAAHSMGLHYPNKLTALLDTLDVKRLRSALFGLSFAEGTTQFIEFYIFHENGTVAASALDAARHQENKSIWPKVEPLSTHPSPWVRGAVLRYAGHILKDAAVPLLVAGLTDPEARVRENAIDELDDLGVDDPEIVSMVRDLLSDPDANVVQAAEWFLNTQKY